jgi:hypothetical protein
MVDVIGDLRVGLGNAKVKGEAKLGCSLTDLRESTVAHILLKSC